MTCSFPIRLLALTLILSLPMSAVQTVKEVIVFHEHKDPVWSIAFGPNSKTLASVDLDGKVKLWDIAGKRLLVGLDGDAGALRAIAFSPNGKHLAWAGMFGTVKVFDLESNNISQTLRGHQATVFSLAFSSDGKTLASAGRDQTIKLWDTGTFKERATVKEFKHWLIKVQFVNDMDLACVVGLDGTRSAEIKIIDTLNQRATITVDSETPEDQSIAINADGTLCAWGLLRGIVQVWDVKKKQGIHTLKGHKKVVQAIAFSNDNKMIASGGRDGVIIWDLSTGKEIVALGVPGVVNCLAFDKSNSMLASGCDNGVLRIWSVGKP